MFSVTSSRRQNQLVFLTKTRQTFWVFWVRAQIVKPYPFFFFLISPSCSLVIYTEMKICKVEISWSFSLFTAKEVSLCTCILQPWLADKAKVKKCKSIQFVGEIGRISRSWFIVWHRQYSCQLSKWHSLNANRCFTCGFVLVLHRGCNLLSSFFLPWHMSLQDTFLYL